MRGFVLLLFMLCSINGFAADIQRSENLPLYVGVFENVKTFDHLPVTSQPHIRVAFERLDGKWLPMKFDLNTQDALAQESRYYPQRVDWTVIFDGKEIGKLTSKNPETLAAYGDVGAQLITSDPKNIPVIHTGAEDFYYTEGASKTRPLLVVSAPNFKDPEGWKRTTLSPAEKQSVISGFRKKIPKLEQCKAPEEEPIKMVPYEDKAHR